MLEQRLIEYETYREITSLQKQYLNLPYRDFPCKGALSAWRFLLSIIELLKARFERYSSKQLQFLQTILPLFETFCGYLNDSKTKNVPWSVIPSLEELFSKIRPGTEFVICPIWETNYKIFNRNIIEFLDSKLLRTQGFLFDVTPSFDDNRNTFLAKFPSGIYFVFYPRTEKLNVLHFPLLGHEIGHIFAGDWIDSHFEDMSKKYNIKEKVKAYIDTQIPDGFVGPLFKPKLIDTQALGIINIYKRIVSELLSDIVGAFIFGHSALLSNYIFSLKFNIDDFRQVPQGYVSWRFRLYFIQKAIARIGLKEPPNIRFGVPNWYDEIRRIIDSVEVQQYHFNQTGFGYVKYILELLDNEFDSLCDSILTFLKDQKYTNIYSQSLQEAVVERLSNGIVPNCVINNELVEEPICLRNIVGGTWLYLINNELSLDYNEYFKSNYQTNLLSLKGIELSYSQKRFLKDDTE
jgi:hypothetical protein